MKKRPVHDGGPVRFELFLETREGIVLDDFKLRLNGLAFLSERSIYDMLDKLEMLEKSLPELTDKYGQHRSSSC